MKSSVDQLSDTRVKLTVEVPFDEMKKEIDAAYKTIAAQVTIPGFRKGKAPRQLIDARFGRGVVLEQVINDMLPSRYGEAVSEQNLNVLGQPSIDIAEIEDGKHVTFTAEVDVRPEFELPDFSKYEVEVDPIEDTDKLTGRELDLLRERFVTLKPVERPIEDGDQVKVAMTAEIDGKAVEELAEDDLTVIVGSDTMMEGVEDALLGMSVGDEKTIDSTADAGEHEGKKVSLTIKVNAIKGRELPELDDEFAQMASPYDTIDELKENVKTQALTWAKTNQASAVRDKVMEQILSESTFPLPESVVDEQVAAQRQQVLAQVRGDEKVFDEFLKKQDISREKWEADVRESVERAVRTQLLLDALADKHGTTVNEQEFRDHIVYTAQNFGMEPQAFFDQVQRGGQIASLYADVRRGKALAAALCEVNAKDTDGNKIDVAEFFDEEIDDADTKPQAEGDAADNGAEDDK